MRKIFACLCVCGLLLAAGCGQSQTSGQPGGDGARPTMGTVTAVDGSQITVQLGGRGGMGGGQPASSEMPQRPDGEMPEGQPPASGEMPQPPEGEPEQEELTFDLSGATVQRQTDDGTESASADEIAVGDLVQLEMDESGEVTLVTILPARTDTPADAPASTAL